MGDTSSDIAALNVGQMGMRESSTDALSAIERVYSALNDLYPTTNSDVSDALHKDNIGNILLIKMIDRE